MLDVDAAVIGMPDARRELLTPRAEHIKDAQLRDAAHVILWRARAVRERGRAATLPRGGSVSHRARPRAARAVSRAGAGPAPSFRSRRPAETIAALQIFSFRPGDPISDETVDAALAIAGQAALAIDNARLYQQQKEFADTMQRSLLPRADPDVPGSRSGRCTSRPPASMSAATSTTSFELDDGRLAVVLGDVTGHGVEATADMAMAKFVFRSLAREHPEPGDFLAFANDVVVDEIAPGKFITMTYLAVDPGRGEVACANAGHPPPRLVLPDGTVRGLDAAGIVLGIDSGQTYEEVRAELPIGSIDRPLHRRRRRGAERRRPVRHRTARRAALERARAACGRARARGRPRDARSYAGGELSDDLAVVVIRRVS